MIFINVNKYKLAFFTKKNTNELLFSIIFFDKIINKLFYLKVILSFLNKRVPISFELIKINRVSLTEFFFPFTDVGT